MYFTVFTPTYNRCNTIHRVYNSLCNQTYQHFEWLIIDDGSTDQTEELIADWIKEDKIKIRYYKQENTHKFFTILKAAKLAEGEFIYILDSDDECLPEALSIFKTTWESIEDKDRYSSITGLCQDQFGQKIGDSFPTDVFDSNSLASHIKWKIKGEKSGIVRADLLKQFSFDDRYFSNGYISEGVLWFALANQGYKTRYINNIVRVYYVKENAMSIMNNNDVRKNSFGILAVNTLILNSRENYFRDNPIFYIRTVLKYIVASFFQQVSLLQMFSSIHKLLFKIMLLFFLPLGYLTFLRYNSK